MKRSALKRKASKTKQQGDITKYEKERNLVVKLNRETKLHYVNDLKTSKNLKPYQDKCRPNFSNKHVHGDSKIIPTEELQQMQMRLLKKTFLVNNEEIAKTFNKHFAEMLEKLGTFEWRFKITI